MPNDFVLSSPDGRYRITLSPGEVVEVGRAPDSGFQIMDPAVSRRHATLVAGPKAIEVTDNGSTAGTRISGHRLTGAGQARVGDVIEFGPVRLQVETRDPSPVAPAPAPRSRLGQVAAIVGVGAAVLSAVVGLLVYLGSRPTTQTQFEESVDQWCTAYQASYPESISARDTANGQWHPERTRELGTAVVDHDRRFLAEFRELEPPAELRGDYDTVDGTLEAVLAEDRRWTTRLEEMSDREIRQTDFLRVPGTNAQQLALGRELTAGLSELSGGRCQPEPP